MPPAAQRTVYLSRANAESRYLEGGSQVDDARRGGGGQEIAEAAGGGGAGVAGRARGAHSEANNAATAGQDAERMTPKHHARNWGRERVSKASSGGTSSTNMGSEAGEDRKPSSSGRSVARHETLEREAKYEAKKPKHEEPNVSTIGIYTLIGSAQAEELDRRTEKGVVSKFSSMDVPTATGFTTSATGTSRSHARFIYAPATTFENQHTTIKGPPAALPAATTVRSVSHGDRQIDTNLPTSYVISWYIVLAVLVVLWSLSILLWFVNFPPWFLVRKKAISKRGKKQYAKVPQNTGDAGITSQEIGSAAFTTSSDTPSLSTPGLRPRRHVSQEHTETEAAVGLGIELSDMGVERQRSFINTTNEPLPEPPRSASLPGTAPLPARFHFDDTPLIKSTHTQDLENGLAVNEHNYDNTYLSPHRSSPYSSSDSEPGSGRSSRSASPHRVLKKVGDGIEYLADKAVKMMHDQVKDDPEEDLLLPVRDCERERRGEGLEKTY